MNLAEAVIVVVALVVAGAVAIVNKTIDPVLAGIIGTAIGYSAKGALSASVPSARAEAPPFKGAPDA